MGLLPCRLLLVPPAAAAKVVDAKFLCTAYLAANNVSSQ